MKITAYANELLDGLDQLEGWPTSVKTMQKNWIGKSEGLELSFDIENSKDTLKIFTTRPDTLFGATYMAVAAEHPLASDAASEIVILQVLLRSAKETKHLKQPWKQWKKKGCL